MTTKTLTWREAGTVAIDTGRVLLADPAYLTPEVVAEIAARSHVGPACETIPVGNGHLGTMVTTGYGDWIYAVEILVDDEEIVHELRIRFVWDDEQ